MKKSLAIIFWRIGIIFCQFSENLYDFKKDMSDFEYWNSQDD